MISKFKQVWRYPLILAAVVTLTACGLATSTRVDIETYRLPAISAGAETISQTEFVAALGQARVVAVGETHHRYDHHLNQLEVVRLMHRSFGDIAIGLEYFQQPFQQYLDAYVRGEIGDNEMLRRTEYYERWKYDFRLNQPVLAYAREHGIPLLALNVPAEVTRKFQLKGRDGLTAEDRQWLPDEIDRSNGAYRERLERIFAHHPIGENGSVDRLVEGQLIWDEGMAQRAAEYLEAHPKRKLVILAGRGHIEFGHGIPDRLERRLGPAVAGSVITVLQHESPLSRDEADYVVVTEPRYRLPKAGLLGVLVAAHGEEATVTSLSDGGAARDAGILEGDVITAIDDEPVNGFADLKASLWSKLPGETVQVRVRRSDAGSREFAVALR